MTTTSLHDESGVERSARSRLTPGGRLAATALVVGAAGNTLQAVLGQLHGGRPSAVEDQLVFADEHTALMVTMCLSGTLAVPFMAIGFVAACRFLARRARRTALVAGVLLLIGMWGFQVIQAAETIQLAAMLDSDGHAAAIWMEQLESQPLLMVFGAPFLLGVPLGLLVLTIALLVTGALPRWVPGAWLAFVVLDFGFGAVGPVDPHWLYLAGAVGLAVHIARHGGRAWRSA